MQRMSFGVTEDLSHTEAEKSSEITPVSGSLPSMENLGNTADDGSSVKENPKLMAEKQNNGLVKWLKKCFLTSVSGESKPRRLDRSKSTAGQALKGLKSMTKADGEAGWPAVEKRFRKITATTDGLLIRSKFGECIGKSIVKSKYIY